MRFNRDVIDFVIYFTKFIFIFGIKNNLIVKFLKFIYSRILMFSKKDKSNPIFVESSGDAIVVRSGGTFDNATGSTTLLTISKSSMTNAIDQVYEGGMLAKTGRAEFSDGTYLDIKNGRIVGGNTKEGGTF